MLIPSERGQKNLDGMVVPKKWAEKSLRPSSRGRVRGGGMKKRLPADENVEPVRGVVTSIRQGKGRGQHPYETLVDLSDAGDPEALIGARVEWTRADGFRIVGRVVDRHGRGRAVRVRWTKGFPPQGLGTTVSIHAPK